MLIISMWSKKIALQRRFIMDMRELMNESSSESENGANNGQRSRDRANRRASEGAENCGNKNGCGCGDDCDSSGK